MPKKLPVIFTIFLILSCDGMDLPTNVPIISAQNNDQCLKQQMQQTNAKIPVEEQKYWATKKSNETNPRRLREESAEKIDLDSLAHQIHYDPDLLKETGTAKISPDDCHAIYEVPKEWYYGRRINTLLLNACTDDSNHEIVKQLLAGNANPNAKINHELIKISGYSLEFFKIPLFIAVEKLAEKNVELLLKSGAHANTLLGITHDTALHIACKAPRNEAKKNIVRFLLSYGADPNTINGLGETCLCSLVNNNSWDQSYIALLLEYGLNSSTRLRSLGRIDLHYHERICMPIAQNSRPMALFRLLWKRAQTSDFKRLPRELALQIAELVYHESKLKLPEMCEYSNPRSMRQTMITQSGLVVADGFYFHFLS